MEYTKKQKTAHTAAVPEQRKPAPVSGGIPNRSMEAIFAGRARASADMMGYRQDLAPSLNTKMSKAFGMDLSGMQVYRSNAMSGTETEGLARGNRVVLSSDIDLNTTAGQAILGHEISHVRAQSQGIGLGHTGLYQNNSLEHQADVEGAMAARGQSILGESAGMDMGVGMGGIGGLTPLGPGLSASAGAPLQAKKKHAPEKGCRAYQSNFLERGGFEVGATSIRREADKYDENGNERRQNSGYDKISEDLEAPGGDRVSDDYLFEDSTDTYSGADLGAKRKAYNDELRINKDYYMDNSSNFVPKVIGAAFAYPFVFLGKNIQKLVHSTPAYKNYLNKQYQRGVQDEIYEDDDPESEDMMENPTADDKVFSPGKYESEPVRNYKTGADILEEQKSGKKKKK